MCHTVTWPWTVKKDRPVCEPLSDAMRQMKRLKLSLCNAGLLTLSQEGCAPAKQLTHT
jgi:hypothetical protein